MARQPRQDGAATGITVLALSALLSVVLVQLLVAPDGLRKTRDLRAAVARTEAEIGALQDRNAALAGEVRNLKHGLDAAEERARADLGMIGENESFYQIIGDDARRAESTDR
ncbi:MAG: septum formation initiator family protein [Pseudomonadota bacterium]